MVKSDQIALMAKVPSHNLLLFYQRMHKGNNKREAKGKCKSNKKGFIAKGSINT